MGGMIAQTIALEHPRVLNAVVLCDTASGQPPEAAGTWRERIEMAEANGMAALVDVTIERWFSPGFVTGNDGAVEPVREMIRNTNVTGFAGCCQAISSLALTDRLPGIAAPTLIIVGEDDPGTPVAASEVMKAGIAGSEMVVLPGARHLSNIEDPGGFNAALTGFLAKQ
jgi:3-oxoadipate enol-lactonase